MVHLLYSQTLDICTSGDCSWNDPSSDIIPVCTKTASSCTIKVSGSHSGGKVYSAATRTHIDCDKTNGCKNGEYHCGNELPPNYEAYGLTASDFEGSVSDCYFDCTSGYLDICKNANFYCSGDVQDCRVRGSSGIFSQIRKLYVIKIKN